YTELSKRLDFLCDSHYDLPKQKIDQKQKDKLIIQALVYAKNNLFPLLECNKKSFYRTLSMFTGEEKFVEGYKLSLDDMKKILSCTKNSVLNSFTVLKFCKDCRAKDVQLFDILKLAKKMNISIGGKKQTGCDVCLEDDRNKRSGVTGYRSMSYNLFDKNDFETYMSELLESPEEKEFDIWFPFFLTEPVLPEKRSSDENKKIRSFFSHLIDKIPNGYLQLGKFRSLVNYFANHNTENAINLISDDFNKFMSKINKHMDKKHFESFKAITVKYFRINGREISDQEIEDAYNGVKVEDINAIEDTSKIQEMNNNAIINGNNVQDINESKIINKNIEANNFEENMAEVPGPSYQNINEIAKIRVKIEELKTRKSDLENQITELKRDAEELSHKNWVVQKFLGIFYYILNLIKKSKLNKIDKQIADLNEQLKTLQNSAKPKKPSDALSELEEEPVPNMQSALFIRKNKNK
ncbi:MAG: hypothetical protein IJU86_00140, partial [Firmicutes bacterium]|nr:hypothetical protein [Bacillota bacterium]